MQTILEVCKISTSLWWRTESLHLFVHRSVVGKVSFGCVLFTARLQATDHKRKRMMLGGKHWNGWWMGEALNTFASVARTFFMDHCRAAIQRQT